MATATATATAPPCGDCGTTGGYTHPSCDTPRRFDGSRFGFAGELCNTCYSRAYRRHRSEAERKRAERLNATSTKGVAKCAAWRTAQKAAKAAAKANEKSATDTIQLAEVQRFIRCATVVAEATACDLCGLNPHSGRYDGSEFELEGRICGGCREELRDERAIRRLESLRSGPVRHFCDGQLHDASYAWLLPILNPQFTRDDLTPKASVALILAETRHVFRRRAS